MGIKRNNGRVDADVKITITHAMNTDSPQPICLEIEDASSGLMVAQLHLSADALGKALTGRACQKAKAEIYSFGVERAGMLLSLADLTIPLPSGRETRTGDTDKIEEWLRESFVAQNGWEIDCDLRSRSSFDREGNLHTTMRRYGPRGEPLPPPTVVGPVIGCTYTGTNVRTPRFTRE